ncbi:hypothetical protein FZEAL_3460 [Fusarium zealandicum]|uniref:Uncharacterized protein n=1 Tax=Fusarium zealandicum TaxID=1053134 RepID=A0A8H4UP40_9HYPO|nr:hypothetical protein FZEAL_3460 [Fusarium zealandicum]
MPIRQDAAPQRHPCSRPHASSISPSCDPPRNRSRAVLPVSTPRLPVKIYSPRFTALGPGPRVWGDAGRDAGGGDGFSTIHRILDDASPQTLECRISRRRYLNPRGWLAVSRRNQSTALHRNPPSINSPACMSSSQHRDFSSSLGAMTFDATRTCSFFTVAVQDQKGPFGDGLRLSQGHLLASPLQLASRRAAIGHLKQWEQRNKTGQRNRATVSLEQPLSMSVRVAAVSQEKPNHWPTSSADLKLFTPPRPAPKTPHRTVACSISLANDIF